MKNEVAISTGLVYKLTSDMNQKIELLRQLHPAGIELCFALADDFLGFQITDENKNYLTGMIIPPSIHLPWNGITYEQSPRGIAVLDKAKQLYEELGVRCFVVERTEIADPRVFQGYDLPFAIENDSSKKQFTLPQQVEEFLSQNQKFRFNFDFAHSSEISRFLTQSFIEKQGSRMAQVHISYAMDPRKDHEFLHEHHSIRQQNILSFLQEHLPESVPLVIECVAKAETSTDELREKIENEIKYLRRDWQPRTLKTDYSSSNR